MIILSKSRSLVMLACGALVVACGGSDWSNTRGEAAIAGTSINQVRAFSQFSRHGWYWNASESGTGFFVEGQGDSGFVAFFMYEEGTGKAIWYAASGSFTSDEEGVHVFTGTLLRYRGGQPAVSTNRVTPTSQAVGSVTILFDTKGATVSLPARTFNATRFEFNSLTKGPTDTQPETGWFWNPQEGGRGYAVEVQGNSMFMAMFHYNADGSPTWNIFSSDIGAGTTVANFLAYSGGQTLSGPYVSPVGPSTAGEFRVSFSARCSGELNLQQVPTVSVKRFLFGNITAGRECRSS